MANPKRNKTPWPTQASMTQVYEKNLWGGEEGVFYSGEGSHDPVFVEPYVQVVKSFFQSMPSSLSVCDLGCGDFNVGRHFVDFAEKYIAVDIVPDIIQFNRLNFKKENLEFQHLDIAKDELPNADCAIVRQVLQHLSNAEVLKVVKKLQNYSYVILTEHVPIGEFEPNLDIISGQGIRLKKQSGLNLLAPPFNFRVQEERELLSVNLENDKGRVVTSLLKV